MVCGRRESRGYGDDPCQAALIQTANDEKKGTAVRPSAPVSNEGTRANDANGTDAASPPQLTWSSGVPFRPEYQRNLWRIGNKFYDLTPFLDKHPGGRQILELSRDRFEDSTYAFEAYHVNQKKVRAMLPKYLVHDESLSKRTGGSDYGSEQEKNDGKRKCEYTDFPPGFNPDYSVRGPDLCNENSFFYVFRRRVLEALKTNPEFEGNIGPTRACVHFFWFSYACFILNFCLLMSHLIDVHNTPGILYFLASAFVQLFLTGVLGGYGHNWVHQPAYRNWASISLDLTGFNSETWLRDHNLQHHMFTNTPADHHFEGLDPFFVMNPFKKRSPFSKLCALVQPVILLFGIFSGYISNIIWMVSPLHSPATEEKDDELSRHNSPIAGGKKKARNAADFTITTLLFPLQIMCYVGKFGPLYGGLLTLIQFGGFGAWFFTIVMLNHNTDQAVDYTRRQKAKDWGEEQVCSSSDIGVGSGFFSSMRYIWLNYHTVHHLLPSTDMSKHKLIQEILITTCKEFGISYHCPPFWKCYFDVARNFFRQPRWAREYSQELAQAAKKSD